MKENLTTLFKVRELQDSVDYVSRKYHGAIGLEYDIYNAMGMIANVTATPDLSDTLEMWNYINTMENAVEDLREYYSQYEDLQIKLRG